MKMKTRFHCCCCTYNSLLSDAQLVAVRAGNLINLAKGQREVVQAGTPCLRDIAEEVPAQDIDSAKIQELIQEMLGICRGRGGGCYSW
jgi:hypothetical protein